MSKEFSVEFQVAAKANKDAILAAILQIKPGVQAITFFSPLAALGFDQLDMLELAVILEEKFAIAISDGQLLACNNVGDVATLAMSTKNPTLWAKEVNTVSAPKDFLADGIKYVNQTPAQFGDGVTYSKAKQELDALKLHNPKLAEEKLGIDKAYTPAPAIQQVATTVEELLKDVDELPAKNKWKKKGWHGYQQKANTTDGAAEVTVSLPVPSSTPAIDHLESVKQMLVDAEQEEAYVIVLADAKTLQIDLDEPEDVQTFKERIDMLKAELPKLDLTDIIYTRSKSMRWHITIKLKSGLLAAERLLLQLLLGSDPMREMLGYIGMKRGSKNFTLLLERKEEWEEQKKLVV